MDMSSLFDLGALYTAAVTAASITTRLTNTPIKPDEDAPWLRHAWYQVYPLVEALAFVGDKTKQQPAIAAQLAQAAVIAKTTKDVDAVAEMVESAAAMLGRR
jgi:hypothetical protein